MDAWYSSFIKLKQINNIYQAQSYSPYAVQTATAWNSADIDVDIFKLV